MKPTAIVAFVITAAMAIAGAFWKEDVKGMVCGTSQSTTAEK